MKYLKLSEKFEDPPKLLKYLTSSPNPSIVGSTCPLNLMLGNNQVLHHHKLLFPNTIFSLASILCLNCMQIVPLIFVVAFVISPILGVD